MLVKGKQRKVSNCAWEISLLFGGSFFLSFFCILIDNINANIFGSHVNPSTNTDMLTKKKTKFWHIIYENDIFLLISFMPSLGSRMCVILCRKEFLYIIFINKLNLLNVQIYKQRFKNTPKSSTKTTKTRNNSKKSSKDFIVCLLLCTNNNTFVLICNIHITTVPIHENVN